MCLRVEQTACTRPREPDVRGYAPPADVRRTAPDRASRISRRLEIHDPETALQNVVLFLVTLSSFHDTIHSYNRVKPEKSIVVTYEDGTEGALSALSIWTTGLEPAQGIVQAPASRVEMPSLHPSAHPPRRGRFTDCNARRLRPPATSGCHPAVGIAVATAFPPVRACRGR